jgi:hypothetical protein
MGKVKQHQDAVHHGITQGDQGVKAAPLKRIDHILQKKFHVSSPVSPLSSGCALPHPKPHLINAYCHADAEPLQRFTPF